MPRRRRSQVSYCVQGGHKERPQQRNAANARERARMRVLSRAFCRLKTTLPWVPPDTKLSKLDTLRLATSYIAHLRTVLTDEAVTVKTTVTTLDHEPPHPMTLTWPFSFTRTSGTSGGSCRARRGPEDPDDLIGEDLEDGEDEEEDDDEEWSRCSSQGESGDHAVTLTSNHDHRPQHQGSFLAAHFSDALMDIG